ncbi:MAG: pyruvate kinase [Flavobacteriales bacterium]|nr:pyruvate kinase [Flavobacteriales bacterium]
MNTKQTKILATIGPSSKNKETLKEMMLAGMDVVRLNFSHGDHSGMQEIIDAVRELNEEMGASIALLADLQGPKIRIGKMKEGVVLLEGETFELSTQKREGGQDGAYISYQSFAKDVKRGEKILLDDGKLELIVKETDKDDKVTTTVSHGGPLTSNKGVNLPNTHVSLPSLTEKDRKDLQFALEQNVDWVALSFVRKAADVVELRDLIQKSNSRARIISKIEKPEAIDNIDSIIEETDAIMVARGDLGVEIPMENVPLIQKMLVKKCIRKAKPVIVATQMMESMIENITPTRAEVNDVANAVLDGADAVMLSGETSVGKHPVEVIQKMTRIIGQIEEHDNIFYHEFAPSDQKGDRFISDLICYSSCRLAQRSNAKAIITMTFSGYNAIKISSHRPKAKIVVFTGNRELLAKMSLVWGVRAFYYDSMISTDKTIDDIKSFLMDKGVVQIGDMVVNVASIPISEKGMTNMLKLSTV